MCNGILPPGFRFSPTDVELLLYYLKRKILGKPFQFETIAEVDIYQFIPEELPGKSSLNARDQEWYFFCRRDRKYSNGLRTNRSTFTGFWKTTGRDRPVIHGSHSVGKKKTLVFHGGRGTGSRTDWVIYEYMLEDPHWAHAGVRQDNFVVCKLFKKNGRGPRKGDQHGALFHEEDWEDNESVVDQVLLSGPSVDERLISVEQPAHSLTDNLLPSLQETVHLVADTLLPPLLESEHQDPIDTLLLNTLRDDNGGVLLPDIPFQIQMNVPFASDNIEQGTMPDCSGRSTFDCPSELLHQVALEQNSVMASGSSLFGLEEILMTCDGEQEYPSETSMEDSYIWPSIPGNYSELILNANSIHFSGFEDGYCQTMTNFPTGVIAPTFTNEHFASPINEPLTEIQDSFACLVTEPYTSTSHRRCTCSGKDGCWCTLFFDI